MLYFHSNFKYRIFWGQKFKKYQGKFENINRYNYASDVKYFFNNILNIKSEYLIAGCIASPQLTYSEFSKYLLNDEGYVKDILVAEKKNFILDTRKNIFKYKQTREIKKIFLKIKEEAQYKKLSFLTY